MQISRLTKGLSAIFTTALLVACSSSTEIKYPEQSQNQPHGKESKLITAKSPYQFADKDIQVPANFDTQGLSLCNFSSTNESSDCPLKKPVIRIYFEGNEDVSSNATEAQVLKQLNNEKLGLMFESQLAGLNRFRIVSKDKLISTELKAQMKEQSAKTIAQQLKNNKTLRPDFLLKIDTIKTAERFYAEYNGMAQYSIELTISIIDPFTKEKLAYPAIGKVRIQGTDVKPKQELVYTEVSGRYYTGFDYTNADNINAVFNKIVSKAFDVVIARLLTEMPATAQVLAFKNNQISLDRGRNAGVLNDDTLIIFQSEAGFVEPIAVAQAKPSSQSSVAHVIRWKDSPLAKQIKDSAKAGIYKPNVKYFAVSVGLPASYINTHF